MIKELSNVILSIYLNAVILLSSYLLVRRIIKPRPLVDASVAFLVLYFSQVVAIELLLGVSGRLNTFGISLVSSMVLLLLLLFTRNYRNTSYSYQQSYGYFSELLHRKTIFLLFSIAFCFGLTKIFINLVNPPFGWDSLNYHFTFPVEWLKHGNLNNPITVFDDPSPSYYPINGSLFYLWLIIPFKNVSLADLGQAPFFLLSALCTYSIARKLGLDRQYSVLASLLFLLVPNFFKQLQVAYVDVMIAALFLSCINWLLSLEKEYNRKNILLFSLSLGLMIGTKTVALPYVVLLLIPFLYKLLKNGRKAHSLAILIICVLIFGSYSYIRNFIDTGNPFYPLQLALGNQIIFKGVMEGIVYRAHFRPEDYNLSKALFHEGLGLQTLILVLPAVFFSLPAAIFKKKTGGFNLKYFLLLPLLIYLVYRFVIPLANLRYIYAMLGIGIISAFYLMKTLNFPAFIVRALAVICALASAGELAKRQELVFSIIASVLFFFLGFRLLRFIKNKGKAFQRPLFLIPVIVIFILIMAVFEGWYNKAEYTRYGKMVKYSGFWPDATKAWQWLNMNTSGNNIAYAGRPVPFPLYGTNFKNNVYYVSVNAVEPVKLHYFPDSRYSWGSDFLELHENLEKEGNYRFGADYSVWLNNFAKHDTDFLFIYSLHQTKEVIFPIEDKWAQVHTEKFVPVFGNSTIHIYKVNK